MNGALCSTRVARSSVESFSSAKRVIKAAFKGAGSPPPMRAAWAKRAVWPVERRGKRQASSALKTKRSQARRVIMRAAKLIAPKVAQDVVQGY